MTHFALRQHIAAASFRATFAAPGQKAFKSHAMTLTAMMRIFYYFLHTRARDDALFCHHTLIFFFFDARRFR